jgi:hypothetical protein
VEGVALVEALVGIAAVHGLVRQRGLRVNKVILVVGVQCEHGAGASTTVDRRPVREGLVNNRTDKHVPTEAATQHRGVLQTVGYGEIAAPSPTAGRNDIPLPALLRDVGDSNVAAGKHVRLVVDRAVLEAIAGAEMVGAVHDFPVFCAVYGLIDCAWHSNIHMIAIAVPINNTQ